MYAMEEGTLNGVAFLDVNIFVVSLSSVKNFILIADIHKSVWFVAFQEDPAKLVMLGKDLYPVSVVGSEFIIGDKSLAMLVSDVNHNLHLMSYDPHAIQSQEGQRLIRKGEMNLGYEIQSFVPLSLKPKVIDNEIISSRKMGVMAGTLNGGICSVYPVSEKIFRRLYAIYSRMVTHLEHYAGLNPRGFRYFYLIIGISNYLSSLYTLLQL